MYRSGLYIYSILVSLVAVAYSQNNMTTMSPTMAPTNTTTMAPTTIPMQPLNCTNIPVVPIKPLDGSINTVIVLANDNIRVCNQIIPLLNGFNAKLKLKGVLQQLYQIQMLLHYLNQRIEIVIRRLDCGLVMSVIEARNLKQILYNDQASKRVLNGIKMRLTDIKQRLRAIA